MSEIRSGNVNDLSTPRDFGNNCLNDFLTQLGDDLTGACIGPLNLPQREIVNIIKRAKNSAPTKMKKPATEKKVKISNFRPQPTL